VLELSEQWCVVIVFLELSEPWYALTVFDPSEPCYITAFPAIDISDWSHCISNYLFGITNHSKAVNSNSL
jgi:hypothetical protein